MDFRLISIILLCYFSIGLHDAYAQSQNHISDEDYYSDYQLDYYPHFHSGMDVEFHLVFKSVFNSCGYPIAEVEQISGSLMRITGIPPQEWEGRSRFRVLIDENGNIIDISFWGIPLQEDVKSCFISKIKQYSINPALINLTPVKSKFTYLLIEQAQESTKKKQKKVL